MRHCALFWFTAVFGGCILHAAELPRPVNFVVILGEGHGLSSSSVQMDDTLPGSKSTFIRSPNLEKLASGGMRFANFYAPSPRCTPSRAAILTGKNPARLKMTFVNEGGKDSGMAVNGRVIPPTSSTELPMSETTIAELLKRAGYATAHFGKWHVGRTNPNQHGFDESDGPTNNGGPEDVENPHPKELYGMTERGMNFMERAVKAAKPFYLQLSHYPSRGGGEAKPETIQMVKSWGGLSQREVMEAAVNLDLDIALGMILKKLDALGITTNTYVIFTADHGNPGHNLPLTGGKGTVSEGGLRVPLIVRGPSVKPSVFSHVRATGEDLFPTIAALAHTHEPLPKDIDGGNLLPALTNGVRGTVKRTREEFVVHFPHYDDDARGPASAVWLGDFKLIKVYETSALHLFNVAKDPGERNDLVRELPDKAKELQQRLTNYLSLMSAQVPMPNPNYDPTKPTETKRKRR